MRVTIKEVAQKAGVSTATVSRVLNNVGPVDDDTRRRVREAARELHYIPNAVGRSLSTKRTDAIGLLLPDLHGEFFSEVIRGADETAQQNRFHLLVSSSHSNREEIEAALQVMRGRVDGLIIMSPHIDAHTLKVNLPKSLPVVLLNCYIEDDAFDSLNIDNYGGTTQMVSHLIAHGHRCIAIIKGTEKNLDAEERLRGYRFALGEAGLHCSENLEFAGNFLEDSGYEAAKRILELRPRPTAIFASNDSMAIGAMSALRELGVAVPQEMALTGFDDIPIARYLSPSLTSVHVPISNLGALAIQKLIHAIREKNLHTVHHAIVPTNLAIRESCGCSSHKNTGEKF
ncbi:MAG: LacI family transcriptional regulator [candidate division KSB1 bacterium]|nr:LacI family transcriptional regulator [candidate division KSB1 bacterium]MDZ7300997.1 LacI family transcriptional regulator [candidate division KSB1 bacterium]MDZ7310324.1 LacI family transcriptional regulator [candidate division KSB1 bacterium]